MRDEGAEVNTEELRRDLATEEGRGALTRQSPIGRLVAAVPSLLDEIERLRRRAKSDSDGLNRWCDYQDRLFAVMTSDEIRAFDARLTEGGWSNEPLCRHEAEVAALRRQIEELAVQRDNLVDRLLAAERVNERVRRCKDDFAALPNERWSGRFIAGALVAALSSVPDVPAARDDEIEQRFLAARREANERYDALGDEPEPEPLSSEFRAALIAAVGRPLRVRSHILLLAAHATGHLVGADRGCRVCHRDWPCEDVQRAAAPALEAFADDGPGPVQVTPPEEQQ